MKFVEWIESVDPYVLPVTIDAAVAVFSAGLITALLKLLLEFAA